MSGRMHADEVDLDVFVVRRLLAAQFPRWADLPLTPVDSAGTDNAIYRLGADKAVRLPRIPSATGQVDKEQRWLPKLAPSLPLPVPLPLGKGAPGEGYPWHWSVYRWLEGRNVAVEDIPDVRRTAVDLAGFVAALHRIDPSGGPAPGPHNFGRGVPLADRDAATRKAIAELRDEVDTAAVTEAWDVALGAQLPQGPGVWVHGDLSSGNLLFHDGRLAAVVDFGGLGVGDPAVDLSVAWELFPAPVREVFRTAVGTDAAAWERGRGWALSIALIQLPYYRDTNPVIAARARRVIEEVLADHRDAGV
ncbi:aminoglycoside phosphotransferase family protein [Streptomyces sp. NPDC003247]|uniref:aminoglycoside phosphotransferase family protein n=1 Tax=Streptomyces sp. NPDC003247 TaxID=3364677 RepID=UPI003693A2B0